MAAICVNRWRLTLDWPDTLNPRFASNGNHNGLNFAPR
jgi:hypothetical protein